MTFHQGILSLFPTGQAYHLLDTLVRGEDFQRNSILDLKFSAHGMNATNKLNKGTTVRGVLKGLMINVVPAFILFLACKNILRTSDLAAVLISSIPATIATLVDIARHRRVDLFSALTIIANALGIILPLLSGNPRFYFARHSLITLILGIAYLVSLLFKKPLWFYIGRYFLTGNDLHNIAQFDLLWQYPYFRTAMRLMTLFWGAFSLIFLVIYVPLIFTLPIALLVLIQPVAGATFWLILLGWTGFYIRRIVKRLDEIKKTGNDVRSNEASQTAS